MASPGEVRHVLSETMAKNNRANAALDTGLLATYEAGSAFAIDAANYQAERKAEKATRTSPPNAPFEVEDQLSVLEREPSWPVQLLAGGRIVSTGKKAPKGPSCDSLLDFEKTGSSRPWKIVLEPAIGPSLPHLAVRGGYAAPVSAGAVRAADSLPKRLVRALFHLETSGQLGPLKRSYFTGGCWQLPNPRVDLVNAEAAGYAARDTYSPVVPADTSVFALSGGKTLAIFTLRFKDEVIAPSPSSPVDWTHPSLNGNSAAAWTYLLPAGRYLQVTERGELQVAAVLSSSRKSYTIIGDYYGFIAVEGSRAPQRPANSVPSGTLAAAHQRLGRSARSGP